MKWVVFLVFLVVVACAAFFLERASLESSYSAKERVSSNEIERFLIEVKGRFVFVEGGRFLMGDFGLTHGEEGLPLDSKAHSKPLHEVVLSGYYIDKYKITNEDFGFYLKASGGAVRADVPGNFYLFRADPRLPARIDWFEAEKYCAWLADISHLPFSMATEAQWEYAARSRGQFLMIATDDGTYRYQTSVDGEITGVNISSSVDRKRFAEQSGWDSGGLTPMPVNSFPPNSLGIYSMSDNGREWVKDWYDPDYYKYAPLKDPQGPDRPMHHDYLGRQTKVMRGQPYADEFWTVGVNVHRFAVNPHSYLSDNETPILSGKTARCVINSQESLH
ncbi:MAG TPA: hypothetical protein DIT18_07895 [Pseudomonas sp.]|nr:hypothetical protein [Pseudomonas sp.]